MLLASFPEEHDEISSAGLLAQAGWAATLLGCSSQLALAVEGTREKFFETITDPFVAPVGGEPFEEVAQLKADLAVGLRPFCVSRGEFDKPIADVPGAADASRAPGRADAAAFSRRSRSSAVVGTGRRALRAARRVQVSAPLGSVAFVKWPHSFEQSFVPYRRFISCDSDLHAFDATLSSVSRVLPSSGSVGRARALVARGCTGVVCMLFTLWWFTCRWFWGTVRGLCSGCSCLCGRIGE